MSKNTVTKEAQFSTEVTRKTVHIGNGFWSFALAIFPRELAILVTIIALVVVLSMNPRIWNSAFEKMARENEKQMGFLLGPFIYVVMVMLLVITVDLRVAAAAFAILAFGDGFATLVGIRYGKHKIGNNKTVEGSLAFFIIGTLFVLLSFWIVHLIQPNPQPFSVFGFLSLPTNLNIALSTLILVFGSFLTTLVEIYGSKKIDDNILIPLTFTIIVLGLFNIVAALKIV